MISLKCPQCGFFFSVSFPNDITPEDEKEARKCPCGAEMQETPFDEKYIPTLEL